MRKHIFIIMMLSVFLCLCSCGHDPLPEDKDRTDISEVTEIITKSTEAAETTVTKSEKTKKAKVRETETAETTTAAKTEEVFIMQPLVNKPAPAETAAPATVPPAEAPKTEAPAVSETAAVTEVVQEVTVPAETATEYVTASAEKTTIKTTTARITTVKTTTARTTTSKTTTARTTTSKTTTTAQTTTTEPPVTTEEEYYEEEVFDSYVSVMAEGWYNVNVLDVIPEFPDNITGWGIVLAKTDSSAPFCLNMDPELCRRAVSGRVNGFRFDGSEIYTVQSGLYRRGDVIGCRPLTISDSAYFDDVRFSDKSSAGEGDEDVAYTITESEDPIARNIDDLYYDVYIEGWFTASVIKTYNGDTGIGCGAIMSLFQDVPFYISLPEKVCSKIEAQGLYAFHIPRQKIRTGLDNLFMYEAGDINLLAIIENQPEIDSVREPKAVEVADECWHVKYTL